MNPASVSPTVLLTVAVLVLGGSLGAAEPMAGTQKADGYRGIWYYNQPSKDEFKYKYSGGFATYPQQHVPIAIHARDAKKTFFCYGGCTMDGEKYSLLHMVAYYDHTTGQVPRPTILLNKKTTDAHDNPTLLIDDKGHLWIFSNSHGTSRPSFIHRSREPYSINGFDLIKETNFSYGQPWFLPGNGFCLLHTRYQEGQRRLHVMTSKDGRDWEEPRRLAHAGLGHYQVSWRDSNKLGTAFNYHPRPVGLNARTNLYYLETVDGGKTWRTATEKQVELPLTEAMNPALVHDYEKEKLLVYLKDLQFDAEGRPVILYLTSKGFESGPSNGPRVWRTARWTGRTWVLHEVTTSDHNYDHGSLYLEADGTWRLIAPTEPGPQAHATGGEVVMWLSRDEGRTWKKERQLTKNSRHNHTYVRRPVDPHPDFYALWADGNAFEPSSSRLYFTDRTGEQVWRLPDKITTDHARPERVR